MTRIWIRRTYHDVFDPRTNDRIGARARSTRSRARFKRHVHDCTRPRRLPASEQSQPFCMGTSVLGVETFGNNATFFDDQRTDHRIWMRITPALARQLERATHIRFVL